MSSILIDDPASQPHPSTGVESTDGVADATTTITLKEWFLWSGRTIPPDEHTNQEDDQHTTDVDAATTIVFPPPRILLLDGGVSTHLEEKIRQCRCCSTNSTSTSTTDTEHANDDVFPYRELWSSSLLLKEDGRQVIYHGHLDWLQQAQVDVITTVTYQCHYIPALWPQQPPPPPTSPPSPVFQQEKGRMNDGTIEELKPSKPIITYQMMDQMWYDGIRLAQQAVLATTTTTINDTTAHPRHNNKYVVASSGCYGAALSNGAEYTGVYSVPTFTPTTCQVNPDQESIQEECPTSTTIDSSEQHKMMQIIHDFHYQKLQVILRKENDPPVNGIAIETVPSYLECQVLCDLLLSSDVGEQMTNVACYISLSCRNGSQLNDGTMLVDALKVFHTVPVTTLQAIGLNCCSIRYIPDLLRILLTDIVQHTPYRGIVIFPNSGELWDGTTKQWYPDPEFVSVLEKTTHTSTTTDAVTLMNHVIHHIDAIWEELCCDFDAPTTASWTNVPLRLRRKPSILLGGCCRMTVETIAALRLLVDEYIDHNNKRTIDR